MGWREELGTTITGDIGLSDTDRQGIFNLARKQGQGGWNAGMEQLKEGLAGRGFRMGESGYGDTAAAQMLSSSAEDMGNQAREISLEETKRRQSQNQELAALNLQRALGLGGLDMQAAGIASSGGAAADRLAWEKEQFGQEFAYQKEQDALKAFYGMYDTWNDQANDVYAPYYGSIAS